MANLNELMEACNNGDLDNLKRLIHEGSNVNEGNYLMSPLMLASRKGYLEIVKELIKSGANVNQKSGSGITALMMASDWNKGTVEIVRELIKHGANVNEKNNTGETALMIASTFGKLEIVEQLIKDGANVNEKDNTGETALMKASEYANLEIAEELIKHGANVNEKDNYGKTALMNASVRNHLEMAEELIKHGANINEKDTYGRTVLTVTIRGTDNVKKVADMAGILIKNGAKISEGDYNELKRLQGNNKVVDTIIALFEKNYETLNQCLGEYYSDLKIKFTYKDYEKNASPILDKIDQAKTYIKVLKNTAKNMIKQYQQTCEGYIKQVSGCKNVDDLKKIITDIGEDYISDKDLIMKEEGNIETVKESLMMSVKQKLDNLNKVMQPIRNLETKLELDYKQLVMSGINLGKKKDKQLGGDNNGKEQRII